MKTITGRPRFAGERWLATRLREARRLFEAEDPRRGGARSIPVRPIATAPVRE